MRLPSCSWARRVESTGTRAPSPGESCAAPCSGGYTNPRHSSSAKSPTCGIVRESPHRLAKRRRPPLGVTRLALDSPRPFPCRVSSPGGAPKTRARSDRGLGGARGATWWGSRRLVDPRLRREHSPISRCIGRRQRPDADLEGVRRRWPLDQRVGLERRTVLPLTRSPSGPPGVRRHRGQALLRPSRHRLLAHPRAASRTTFCRWASPGFSTITMQLARKSFRRRSVRERRRSPASSRKRGSPWRSSALP